MKITEQEVRHIASLARLRLSDDEVEKLGEELGQIKEFVETLNEVDVSSVDATAYILDKQNVLREDELKPSFDRELILKNAPAKEAGCISVPKVVE
ncbi:MAG: Asp-tRNA(Asn)/Glu-tRNA(Gln) amidotransferase subunit GatC [Clostridia bacterium]|nr:Asp-tRNA(Asn)/Glu-tRNA(Gln) amidotransferase subunit GatC [Clostridia bacterium]